MEKLFCDARIKEIERRSVSDYSFTSPMMMESAAMLIFKAMQKEIRRQDNITIVVGKGNNGADGLALSRLLYLDNYNVSVYLTSNNGTSEFEKQLEIVKKLGVSFTKTVDSKVIVDGIIGIGLKGELREDVAELIDSINLKKAFVISIDVPSGIGSASRFVTAIKADITYSISTNKLSFYLLGNRGYCGKIKVLKPLFPSSLMSEESAVLYRISDLSLPPIESNEYKKTRGELIVVGGSKEYPSTVLLSSRSAFKTGAGLVTIYTEKENVPHLYNSEPSFMVRPYSAFKNKEDAVLLLGPGLSSSNDDVLLPILKLKNRKVIDADGIRAYARLYKQNRIGVLENAVLTPHLGELKALLESVMPECCYSTAEEYTEVLKSLSLKINATLVVKSEIALIVDKNRIGIVDLSNPSLAVAGSGDVLSAIIATLYFKCSDPAISGVLLHKKCGKKLKAKLGYYSASELIDEIGENR